MLDSQRKYELRIRPLGRRAADEYYHNGAIWIEGRNGNRYTVDICNHTNQRVLFIVSVDGMDILKGKPAGPDSEGYLVDAMSTVAIPGWKLNDNEAAEFFFSRSDDSYVNSIGGNTSNTGVIGAMVFSERAPVYTQSSQWLHNGYGTGQSPFNGWPTTSATWSTGTYGINDTYSVNSSMPISGSGSILRSNAPGMFGSSGPAGPVGAIGPAGTSSQLSVDSRRVDASNNSYTTTVNSVFTTSPVQQEIGTGFGDVTEWQTTATTFARANPTTPDAILAVYYNTARNLEKMGIQLKKKKDVARIANAFPAYSPGCKPPVDWKR